ncbi:hypothetical protein CDCA_CDCA09G2645 [Cyanidium caldarium]|uniref:F-box domain-containing protein n=1 Tax=Cyanidium caldarium TaxID=2771 RepID=A0AAV9IWY0_CYACA|nr:hypothetical protein CDCA_CDCA09G2645 [Cyanidium caldarium]
MARAQVVKWPLEEDHTIDTSLRTKQALPFYPVASSSGVAHSVDPFAELPAEILANIASCLLLGPDGDASEEPNAPAPASNRRARFYRARLRALWFCSGQDSLWRLAAASRPWRALLGEHGTAGDSYLRRHWDALAERVFGCALDESLTYIQWHMRNRAQSTVSAVSRYALLAVRESCHICAKRLAEPDLWAVWPLWDDAFLLDGAADGQAAWTAPSASRYLAFPCCRLCFWGDTASTPLDSSASEDDAESRWLQALAAEIARLRCGRLDEMDAAIAAAPSLALSRLREHQTGVTLAKARLQLRHWRRRLGVVRAPDSDPTIPEDGDDDDDAARWPPVDEALREAFERQAFACRLVSDAAPASRATSAAAAFLLCKRVLLPLARSLLLKMLSP